MSNIYEIIGNLLAAFVVGLLAYLAPKAKAWLVARIDKTTYDKLMMLVTSFARAAEQLYHDTDLRRLDVEITDAVINMIEGAVWEINTETKKAQVQAAELISLGEVVVGESFACPQAGTDEGTAD